jgi:2-polyprenyl-3-methyl-5-hydroxy-6-metoxy-1,4-benzoquinol methylase
MVSSAVDQHRAEVQDGQRFEFGKNWRRFLSALNDERVSLAEESLRKFLGVDRLDGKTFLDVGSGSGLFSLAARRLGAHVRSFDYDPHSVACTAELRRRYFPSDPNWTVEQGSVLDRAFLARLGEFDIVYSWGVLHHTGAMWTALDSVKPLVRMGGQLYIAIYNDLGEVTEMWLRVKRRYNALPRALRLPFAISIVAASEQRTLRGYVKRLDLGGYIRTWTEYKRASTRGMSRWHDWIDWIGGYPYECASIDAIVDAFASDGFVLTRLGDRSAGYGCNEFVFKREAPLGTMVDQTLSASRWFARRFGRRLDGPFARSEAGWVARVPAGCGDEAEAELLLFRGEDLVGSARTGGAPDQIIVAPGGAQAPASGDTYRVVRAKMRSVPGPFARQRGHMWAVSAPELTAWADNAPGRELKSPLYVFEDGRQLGHPHSLHDDIAGAGKGRFSHWGDTVYFASSDNTDPNTNGRVYCLVYRLEE